MSRQHSRCTWVARSQSELSPRNSSSRLACWRGFWEKQQSKSLVSQETRSEFNSQTLIRFSCTLTRKALSPFTSMSVVSQSQSPVRAVRPNPSIERTSPGKPGAASHLKR